MFRIIMANIFCLLPGMTIFLADNLVKYVFGIYKNTHVSIGNMFDCKIQVVNNLGSALAIAVSDQYISRIGLYLSYFIFVLLSYWFIKCLCLKRKTLLGVLLCCSFFSTLYRVSEHRIFNFLDLHVFGLNSFQINFFDITSVLCTVFIAYSVLRKKIKKWSIL